MEINDDELPGIDDRPVTYEQAKEMARKLMEKAYAIETQKHAQLNIVERATALRSA